MKFRVVVCLLSAFLLGLFCGTLRAQPTVLPAAEGSSSFSAGGPSTLVTSSADWLSPRGSGYSFTANASVRARMGMVFSRDRVYPVLQTGLSGRFTAWGTNHYGEVREIAAIRVAAVAVDANGNVLLVDRAGGQIYRVDAGSGAVAPVRLDTSLNGPGGIAVDVRGNIYIADTGNQRILKMDAVSGSVSIFAGSGVAGFSGDGGRASEARFDMPSGLTVDRAGNVYVADTLNGRIREVRVDDNTIHTVAGTGNGFASPGDGGQAVRAGIFRPQTVAVDDNGNLLIADTGNGRIRRVDAASGVITTIANGLVAPEGVAVDGRGNVFIDDAGSVMRLASDRAEVVGGVAGGAGIASDAFGNLYSGGYFVDFVSPRVIAGATMRPRILPQGAVQPGAVDPPSEIALNAAGSGTFALTVADGTAWSAASTANWLTVTPSSGTGGATLAYRYTANGQTNGRIASITVAGTVFTLEQPGLSGNYAPWNSTGYGSIQTIAGGGAGATPPVNALRASVSPAGVSTDLNGNLLIADSTNDRVYRVDASTEVLSVIAGTGGCCALGDGAAAVSATLNPRTVVADTGGNLFITDSYNHRVRRVDASSGVITTVAGDGDTAGSGDGGAAVSAGMAPQAAALDGAGNLYIADYGNNLIRTVTASNGLVGSIAGTGVSSFGGDGGAALSAGLSTPLGIAVDSVGNVFIADSGNNRVRRVDGATGVITTIAGTGGDGFSGDGGPGTSAMLSGPSSVAADRFGDVFIGDYGNRRVRRVDSVTGVITTVAGGGSGGDGGPASAAGLSAVAGVWVDGVGNLFIADAGRVRFVDLSSPVVALQSATATAGSDAGIGYTSLLVLPASAQWSAVSNASWLTVTPNSGSGSGTLAYSFTANTSASPRSATISIFGQSLVVTQAGVKVRLAPSSAIVTPVAGTGTVSLNVPAGFAWTAYSSAAWMTVSPASGTGPGTLSYSFTGNGAAGSRSGALLVAGSEFELVQTGSSPLYVPAFTSWGPTFPGEIVTIAGNRVSGFFGDGGLAVAASLAGSISLAVNAPHGGMAVDRSGRLYIADTANHRIRRVDGQTGLIATVAGNGVAGFRGDGGDATGAQLQSPGSVAVDAAGNLFIADTGNSRVRRVDAVTGAITTVAGNGVSAALGDGGSATTASFIAPGSVALDSGGNLYVADSGRVRRVNHGTGITSTFAGGGNSLNDGVAATSANLAGPLQICLDGQNNLLILDLGTRLVHRVDGGSGRITTVAGLAINASLTPGASGIACDAAGNVFVNDSSLGIVRRIDASTGAIAVVAGSVNATAPGDGGPAVYAGLTNNGALASDGLGNLYISDDSDLAIRFVDLSTPRVVFGSGTARVGAGSGSGSASFTIAAHDAPWFASSDSFWLTVTTPNGLGDGAVAYSFAANDSILPRTGSITISGQTLLITQAGVPVAFSASSAVLNAQAGTGTVVVGVPAGVNWSAQSSAAWLTVTTLSGSGSGALSYRFTANTSANARVATIFVLGKAFPVVQGGNSGNGTQWGAGAAGNILTVAGGGFGAIADGSVATAVSAGFPTEAAADANGNLFFVSGGRIYEVQAENGIVRAVASSGYPVRAIALDRAGDVYFSDASNRVSRVDAVSGQISAVAGNGSDVYSVDGVTALSAGLVFPNALALDAAENLFISDLTAIRRVDAGTGLISTVAGPVHAAAPAAEGASSLGLLLETESVSVDGSGGVYFVDLVTDRVWRLDATNGTVYAAAGAGGFSGVAGGGDGGPAVTARLVYPRRITVDAGGNLFVSDAGTNSVRRVDAGTGLISTVAGLGSSVGSFGGDGGPAVAAGLNYPSGLAIDPANNLYIADTNNDRIRAVVMGNSISASLLPQTITFGQLSNVMLGGIPPVLTAAASSGLVVSYTSNSPSVCSVNGSVATLIAAGTCSITASQSGNGSYAPATSVTQTFTISTLTIQTIAFGSLSNTAVTGTAPALIATASSGLAVSFASNSPSVCTVNGSVITLVAPGTCSITASQSGNSVYAAATPVTHTFVVNSPASQTITFGALSNVLLGAPPPSPAATASSGLTVTYTSNSPSVCTANGSTITLLATGICSITASQSGNSAYAAAAPVTQTFVVGSLASQTITFGVLSDQVTGAVVPALSATASSGLTVSFASNSASVCTVSGTTITLVAAGMCSITASQAGNSAFAPASPITQTFVVNAPASGGGGAGGGSGGGGGGGGGGGIPTPPSNAITITPTSLTIVAGVNGGPVTRTITITCQSSSSGVSWGSSVSVDEGEGWLSVSPLGGTLALVSTSAQSGTFSGTIGIVADPTGIPGGSQYTGTVSLYTSAGVITIPVVMQVSSTPIRYTLAPAALNFSYQRGGAAPPSQSIAVFSAPSGASFAVSATSAGNWLSASVSGSGATPASVSVSVTADGLDVGSYNGQVTVGGVSLPVTLSVTPAMAPMLAVSAGIQTFTATQDGTRMAGQVAVSNAGGGTLSFKSTATSDRGWLSIAEGGSGTVATGVTASIVLSVDPASLQPGVYNGRVVVTNSATGVSQTALIVLTVTNTAGQLRVSRVGVAMTAAIGGEAPQAETVMLRNIGGGSVNWTAHSSATWLAAAPASGTLAGGAQAPLSISANPAGLVAGDYFGSIDITAPNAVNSPQTVTVVLHVSGAFGVVAVAPAALLLTDNLGSSPVSIYNPSTSSLSFMAAAFTADAKSWLSVSPTNGQLNPGANTIQIAADFNTLSGTEGAGSVTLAFGDGSAATIGVTALKSGTGCTSGKSTFLTPVLQSPANRSTLQADVPVTVQALVMDDCGHAVTAAAGGAVQVSFSNGDAGISLVDIGDGVWQGTWNPMIPAASTRLQVTATASALMANAASAEVTVTAASANAAPQPAGIANAASAGQAIPLVVAPGSYIAIYGGKLASGEGLPASSLPLPTTLNGTQVLLAGVPMPLLYAGGGQINALVPEDIAPNAAYPMVVIRGSARSVPVNLTVTELQPAIYTVDTSGSGSGIVANALTGQLITASNPAHAGDYLAIYATGLGALVGANGETQPGDGAAAPSDILYRTKAVVTATIGGVNAPVVFSGLTATLASLYQVNVQVPSGIAAGDSVALTITASDPGTEAVAQSNAVTIAVAP